MIHPSPRTEPPPQTIHDVEHAPPGVTRAENETAVSNALATPATASELSLRTGLPFIAVAEALQSLIARSKVERIGALRYQRTGA